MTSQSLKLFIEMVISIMTLIILIEKRNILDIIVYKC